MNAVCSVSNHTFMFATYQASIYIHNITHTFSIQSGSKLRFAFQEEMSQDLLWAKSRPTVRSRIDVQEDSEKFEDALNTSEMKSLAAYRLRFPGCTYSLAQNGATSHAMHSTPTCLQTLIRNMSLLWADGVHESGSESSKTTWHPEIWSHNITI